MTEGIAIQLHPREGMVTNRMKWVYIGHCPQDHFPEGRFIPPCLVQTRLWLKWDWPPLSALEVDLDWFKTIWQPVPCPQSLSQGWSGDLIQATEQCWIPEKNPESASFPLWKEQRNMESKLLAANLWSWGDPGLGWSCGEECRDPGRNQILGGI